MSSPLAISGVTAVLKKLLVDACQGAVPGGVPVSALAPDIVQSILDNNAQAQVLVNLFLHQVTPNAAWRNEGYPSLDASGSGRLKNPPLALDLHYLLTVYANQDGWAEALLGFALLLLHENPVLTRNQIKDVFTSLPAADPLATSGLADQIELLKITPTTLGREEMAWLWTALKADYRPTVPFQVSVVLIQPQHPVPSELPVLKRNVSIQSSLLSPFPTITQLSPPDRQPAACLGDTITVTGSNLAGAANVVLTNARLGIKQSIPVLPNGGSASFQFVLPNPALPPPQPAPTDLPAGVYVLSAQVAGGTTTNGLPLAIAPKITSWTTPTLNSAHLPVNLTVPCSPYVRVRQQASLLIGSQEILSDDLAQPMNQLPFTIKSLQATSGPVPVRLRVDGIDSPIIDMTRTPAQFSGPFVQVN